MKRAVGYVLTFGILAMALAGCSQDSAPTAQDDAFQKGLADMAAKNKDAAPPKKSGGITPPGAGGTAPKTGG